MKVTFVFSWTSNEDWPPFWEQCCAKKSFPLLKNAFYSTKDQKIIALVTWPRLGPENESRKSVCPRWARRGYDMQWRHRRRTLFQLHKCASKCGIHAKGKAGCWDMGAAIGWPRLGTDPNILVQSDIKRKVYSSFKRYMRGLYWAIQRVCNFIYSSFSINLQTL